MVDDHSPQEMSDVDLILYTTHLEDGWADYFANEVICTLMTGWEVKMTTISRGNKGRLTDRSARVDLNFA